MSQGRAAALQDYFLAWRTVELRDRQVIDGLVHPAHAGPSPELARALAQWPGRHYWCEEPSGRHLILTRERAGVRERWWLHALLLLATLATTTYAGSILAGTLQPGPMVWMLWGMSAGPGLLSALTPGLWFALPLLAILLAHELGHYLTARRYGVDASPPYFIPLPTLIGTVGAFIRLRTIVSDRRQLLDIGIAGPVAGFVVALPVLVWGLLRSEALPSAAGLHGLVVWFGAVPAELGDSLLTLGLRQLIHGHTGALALDPLGFAGWMGLMVTMLNLVPVGQLDGGHLLYAVVPRWHERLAQAGWVALLVLGWVGWRGWLLWAGLVFALSLGRLGHPPVLDPMRPLPRSRLSLSWGAFVLLAITFVPVPFRL